MAIGAVILVEMEMLEMVVGIKIMVAIIQSLLLG